MKFCRLNRSIQWMAPVLLTAAVGAAAHADGLQDAMIEVGDRDARSGLASLTDFDDGEEVPPAPSLEDGAGESPCGPLDPDCRRRLLSLMAGNVNFLQPRVDGGVRFGHGGADAAVRFSMDLLNVDAMIGDLGALAFEAIYVPDAGGVRLRFTLADAEVLFFCTDFETGKIKAPLVGWVKYDCRPDAVIGIGGKVTEIQWDTNTGRVAARWLELQMVANLLANGNGFEYLQRRLNVFAGGSFETVWPGDVPGVADGDADVIGRLKLGVMGMIRSDDARIEVRGFAAYRPSVTDFSDFAIEAKTEFLYHLLFSDTVVGSLGLDAQYSYWTDPSRSIGEFASDRDRHSAYVGALFRLTFGGLGIPLNRRP